VLTFSLGIWRNFSLGKLVDLIMLDTRNYDRSITTLGGWNDDYVTEISNDAGRTLMGSNQENWYDHQFAADSRRYIDFLQVLSPAHRLWRAWGYLASHW
jgi:alkaline phosphatase D